MAWPRIMINHLGAAHSYPFNLNPGQFGNQFTKNGPFKTNLPQLSVNEINNQDSALTLIYPPK